MIQIGHDHNRRQHYECSGKLDIIVLMCQCVLACLSHMMTMITMMVLTMQVAEYGDDYHHKDKGDLSGDVNKHESSAVVAVVIVGMLIMTLLLIDVATLLIVVIADPDNAAYDANWYHPSLPGGAVFSFTSVRVQATHVTDP